MGKSKTDDKNNTTLHVSYSSPSVFTHAAIENRAPNFVTATLGSQSDCDDDISEEDEDKQSRHTSESSCQAARPLRDRRLGNKSMAVFRRINGETIPLHGKTLNLLTGRHDFASAENDSTVVCAGETSFQTHRIERELILYNPNSGALMLLYLDFINDLDTQGIDYNAAPVDISRACINFINSRTASPSDLSKLQEFCEKNGQTHTVFGKKKSFINLERFIDQEAVCRHKALLVAHLLGQFCRDKTKSWEIYRYRSYIQSPRSGRAGHAMVVLRHGDQVLLLDTERYYAGRLGLVWEVGVMPGPLRAIYNTYEIKQRYLPEWGSDNDSDTASTVDLNLDDHANLDDLDDLDDDLPPAVQSSQSWFDTDDADLTGTLQSAEPMQEDPPASETHCNAEALREAQKSATSTPSVMAL